MCISGIRLSERESSGEFLEGIRLTCQLLGCSGALLGSRRIVLGNGRKLLHADIHLVYRLRLALGVLGNIVHIGNDFGDIGNHGVQALRCCIRDLGTVVQSGFSLAIGESKTIKYFVRNPEAVRYVVFNITGVYSSGIVFKDNTKSYTVRPYIDPTTLGLEFRAEVRTQLNRENIIGLTFTVTNTGSTPYTDVVLTEKELDYEIHKIAVLEPNSGAQSFNIDLNVGGERDLVFFLTALDASGNTHMFEAHLTAKYIDSEGTVPNEPPATGGVTVVDDPNIGSKLDGMLTKTGSALKVWYSILIIVAAVALIAIIALAAVEIYKRKNGGNAKKAPRRRAQEDDED